MKEPVLLFGLDPIPPRERWLFGLPFPPTPLQPVAEFASPFAFHLSSAAAAFRAISLSCDKTPSASFRRRQTLPLVAELLYRCAVPAVSCRPDFRPSQFSRRLRSVLVDAVSRTLTFDPRSAR